MSKDVFDPSDPETEAESHERQRRLPSLQELLGDVLEQPLRRSPSSPGSSESQISPHDPIPRDRGPDLAPLSQYPTYPPIHDLHPSINAQARSSTSSFFATPHAPSSHSYHLFNYVPDQGLVHQKSSKRDDLDPSKPKPRLPPSDPARKYVCAECGNRFSKQSTLRNHLLTHSGERPFACTHPGCGRRFSMACNMQRHMRTHTSASAFLLTQPANESDFPYTQPSSRGGSSRGGSSSQSSSRGGSPRDDGFGTTRHSRTPSK